tara:strand:- start:27 stop:1682 length:1656 start_codon:yes stop_codon:yes gene_type:complete
MSQFDYKAKIDIYAPQVLRYFEQTDVGFDYSKTKGVGYIEAIDGNSYQIDLKSHQFQKFKKIVQKDPFDNAVCTEFVKNQSNQFPVSTKRGAPSKEKISGAEHSQAGYLSWREIQKKTFSSPGVKINTEQQEKISLLIFKAVLSSKTPRYDNFTQMFNDPKSGVKDIFPKLNQLESWMDSYNLQFNDIRNKPKFANDSYDVYLYDDPGNFMDYISQLVTKGGEATDNFGINFVTKKDTWDPADVWLLKTGAMEQFQAEINNPTSGIKSLIKNGILPKKAAVQQVNSLLRKYYKEHKIVGISLKKTDGKTLNYVEFNMNASEKESDLADVEFDKIQLNCEYTEKTGSFKSKTSYVFVNDGESGLSYKLAYKSNTGAGKIGNITYEFLPSSKASAFLGKVPKESLKRWLDEQINFLRSPFSNVQIQMPQGKFLPTEWNDTVQKREEFKVKIIQAAFPKSDIKELDKYVVNLEDSFKERVNPQGAVIKSGGLGDGNSSMMQMVDFTFILALMKNLSGTNKGSDKSQLQIFLTSSYYFAQKKGFVYNFGPFGKLY